MSTPTFRYMPKAEVLASVGLCKTALYERIKAKNFPAPVSLGKQCVRWRSDEVLAWMEAQSENRDAGKEDRSAKARAAVTKRIETRRANPAKPKNAAVQDQSGEVAK